MHWSAAAVKEMFAEADTDIDGDGFITFAEFLAAMLDVGVPSPKQELLRSAEEQ